jgi:hypothetical protein
MARPCFAVIEKKLTDVDADERNLSFSDHVIIWTGSTDDGGDKSGVSACEKPISHISSNKALVTNVDTALTRKSTCPMHPK